MGFRGVQVLVAAELGSSWPAWIAALLHGSARRVVSQAEGEPPASFAERVMEIATAELAGKPDTLVLLCNERTDSDQQTARRALLRVARRSGGPKRAQRVLVAARGENTGIQRALEALTQASPVSIRRKIELCFEANATSELSSSTMQSIPRVA